MLDEATIDDLCRGLSELVTVGNHFVDAIDRRDDAAALAAVHHSRQVRANLAERQGAVDYAIQALRPESVADLPRLQTLVIQGQHVESLLERWHQRPLPDDSRMLTAEHGVAYLADAMLPPVWDFERDLAVVIGGDREDLVRELVGLGQERILVFDPQRTARTEAILVTTFDEVRTAIRSMMPRAPARVATRVSSSFAIDPGLHEALMSTIYDGLFDLRIHRNTIVSFGRLWIEQGLANVAQIAQWPTIADVGDEMKNVPMIVVAPGPSLSKNGHLLREMRDKALIVGFSHSVGALKKMGVAVDIVITVDPQDLLYHFKDVDTSKVEAFVNGATVHPALFNMPAGKYLSLSANEILDSWIFDEDTERPDAAGGGSVATTALSVLLGWQASPILFVGLDLSFPEGRYYADTSCDAEVRTTIRDGLIEVDGWSQDFSTMQSRFCVGNPPAERCVMLPGWHGGEVPTSFIFSMFHRWFEQTARQVRRQGNHRLVNCTEGGARIDGMEHMTLAQAADDVLPTTTDGRQKLRAVFENFASGSRRQRAFVRIGTLRDQAAKTEAIARQAIGVAHQATTPEGMAELDRVEKQLIEALEPIYFVAQIAQLEIEAAQRIARRLHSLEEANQASAELFATIAHACSWLAQQCAAAALALDDQADAGAIALRPPRGSDSDWVLDLHNRPDVRAASLRPEPIALAEHRAWFHERLSQHGNPLFIIERAGQRVGVVRWQDHSGEHEISIAVQTVARGRGTGKAALAEAARRFFDQHPRVPLYARIRADNNASRRLFEGLGFALVAEQDGLCRFRLEAPRAHRAQTPLTSS